MATEDKIRQEIHAIAHRIKNVRLEEIDWVMNQLRSFGTVTVKENDHQRMYSFDGHRFGVCTHNPGSTQVKAAYVRGFLAAMADAGWYED
jgi:hypothetical protein